MHNNPISQSPSYKTANPRRTTPYPPKLNNGHISLEVHIIYWSPHKTVHKIVHISCAQKKNSNTNPHITPRRLNINSTKTTQQILVPHPPPKHKTKQYKNVPSIQFLHLSITRYTIQTWTISITFRFTLSTFIT